MAFDARKVQPPDADTDFTHIKDTVATVVTGRGQIVEWRNSKVTVFEKDNDGKEKRTRLPHNADGRLKVEEGWKLYIAEGKFLEFDERDLL
ncbi:uncharacterized protein EKO05_0003978 [Ascochyta rabiei]|uniref:uncharacterized protein n=1 Tax=Didymella rabiei TaxID=5454 RepID=UPI00220350A7|nr:uncharacterized protein EKO05_0003978 [Ascochyta rabiei]UPX13471.1 hypothetical protein EKO05_0003978 [Ascochyta rabiei]